MQWQQREWMMAKPPVRGHGREKSQQQSSAMLSTSHASPQQALMTSRVGRGSSPTRPVPPFCCRVFLGYRRVNVSRTTVYYAQSSCSHFAGSNGRQREPVELIAALWAAGKDRPRSCEACFPPLRMGILSNDALVSPVAAFRPFTGTTSSSQWHTSLIFCRELIVEAACRLGCRHRCRWARRPPGALDGEAPGYV